MRNDGSGRGKRDFNGLGLLLLFLLGWLPLGVGPQRFPRVGSPGSCPLIPPSDETEYVADGSDNAIAYEKEFFETADNGVDAVFEIGLDFLQGFV